MNSDRAATFFFIFLAFVCVLKHDPVGAFWMIAIAVIFFGLSIAQPSAWENVNKRDDDEV